jgi:hypothetical protein
MSSTNLQGASLQFGRVFSRTFGVIGRNWAALAAISLCLAAVPILLVERTHVWLGTPSDPAAKFGQTLLLDSVVRAGATVPFYVLINLLTARDVECTHTDFGRLLTRALTVLPAVIVACLASLLGEMGGLLLLLVPGILLMLAWKVALPAAAVEGCGPFKALGRSAALTRGSRGAILGIMLAAAIPGGLVGLLGTHFLATNGFVGLHTWPRAAFNATLAFFTYPFWGVLITVIYFELRRLREGALHSEVAEVFA